HRDVKPGNLLVRPNGTLVLTDFGIARSALVGQLTVAGSVLGTASYISPEQASGEGATAASDVYALGVVAYQCLSGHRPFDGATPIEIAMKHVRETPRPLPADIPPSVRAIVDRALAKDPGARWPSASAMAAVARQAASALATTSQQPAGQPARTSASASPAAGPIPGAPISGSARPPYPPVPRPTSGARGAASVPSGPPIQQQPQPQPYRPPYAAPRPAQAQPMPSAKPESSAGRQVLIVLAVVLALLVLLCAGVISFLYKQGNNAMSDRPVSVAVAQKGTADSEPSAASYRLTRQTGAKPGWNRANEGRQTL
ncbi:protein kinase domain-containing protein, partial [Paractinoplanes toevensis]|uniref:protein kinase domain-containing protein n=1 Tax=Paractinoplanes toevensis TaxID=571911 RepID=UPI001BB38A7C